MPATATLLFHKCKGGEYTVNSMTTKVFIEACQDLTIHLNGKIITHIVEVWNCDRLVLNVGSAVKTLQLDKVDIIDISFRRRLDFQTIVWAGVEGLKLRFDDWKKFKLPELFQASFSEEVTKHGDQQPPLSSETDQFIVRIVAEKLLQELVVRLSNGYPTTTREADAFDALQKRNAAAMAKAAGITIKPKQNVVKAPGRNDPCHCGSGRKYKVCHGKA